MSNGTIIPAVQNYEVATHFAVSLLHLIQLQFIEERVCEMLPEVRLTVQRYQGSVMPALPEGSHERHGCAVEGRWGSLGEGGRDVCVMGKGGVCEEGGWAGTSVLASNLFVRVNHIQHNMQTALRLHHIRNLCVITMVAHARCPTCTS